MRLPANVVPTSYELHARIVPGEDSFLLKTKIFVRVAGRTDRIWLHGDGVEVNSAKVNGKTVDSRPEGSNHVALELPEPIGPGYAIIELETRAPISPIEEAGLISGTFDGRTYVNSNFEPTGARKAFVLFDEPGFKVPWQVTLTVPLDQVALSNTAPESETVDGGMKTVRFARTTPLPSYLVAFAVGPYDLLDAGRAGSRQIPVRIAVPRGTGARAQLAVDTTKEAIERLEAWFGSPMPYDRVDLVVIQSAAFGGAMENPGHITFASNLLLAPRVADSISRRRAFLSTSIHELAHQWFGNLVTAAWWDDLWLNEAFADFVASEVLAEWKPDWREDMERIAVRDGAMNQDITSAARRIREPIQSNDDIANAFDSITYSKGASVLFMFEHWLGSDVFRRGVRSYLSKHAQRNATLDDFLAAINEAAGRDVSAPFKSFLEQPGVPVISSVLKCEGGAAKVELTQSRYSPLGSSLPAQTWQLPVCMRWNGGRQCSLLTTPSATFDLPGACPKWLAMNEGMYGYYRTTPVVSNAELAVGERLGAALDLSALVQRGDATIDQELALVPAEVASGDRYLIETAANSVESLGPLLKGKPRAALAAFAQKQFAAKWKEVGLTPREGEPDEVRLMRPRLLSTLAVAGQDKKLQAESLKLMRQWLKKRDLLSSELLNAVQRSAALTNDRALYEDLFAAFKVEEDQQQRSKLIGAMARFTAPALAKRSLGLILGEDYDTRDLVQVAFSLSGHDETRDLVFEWLQKNYEKLVMRLPEGWDANLVYLATGFCSQERKEEVIKFFEPRTKKAIGGPREFATAMESYDQCIAWRARQLPGAIKFLESQR
ncbi:MAG: M1 family metallopeptidase [Archangium sp.]